jgi:hypothetical protein
MNKKSTRGLKHQLSKYNLKDNSGEYTLQREVGFSSKNEVVAKIKVSDDKGNLSRPSEKIVAISDYGQLKTEKQKIKVLRPKASSYEIWLEGKKHSNKITMNLKKKSLDVFLDSPVMEWNGKQSFSFPTDSPLFCFFSQVIECASVTDFLGRAIRKKQGKMNFYVIWNGYPFFSEMYSNIPRKLFSKAELVYENKISPKEHRFSLNVEGQKIFYHVGQDASFEKLFWVSQGFSLVKKNDTDKKKSSM